MPVMIRVTAAVLCEPCHWHQPLHRHDTREQTDHSRVVGDIDHHQGLGPQLRPRLRQRLLDQGNATGVSDILACGDEETIRARLAAFESAGVTDISVRVLPIGDGRDELLESSRRTR